MYKGPVAGRSIAQWMGRKKTQVTEAQSWGDEWGVSVERVEDTVEQAGAGSSS